MNEESVARLGAQPLDPFVQALLEDAKRFDANALEKADRQVKRMAIIAIGLLVLTCVSVITSVVQVLDTREVQPFVLLKDEKTGAVTELTRVEPQRWSSGHATDMANVATYVRAREEYSDASSVFNYEQVELMSSAEEFKEYTNWLDPELSNLSPLARYPQGVVDIEITGIVRVGEGAVQAHFTRNVRRVSAPPKPTYWIAHIEYEYLTKNMTYGARLRNPEGFTVRSYSVDEVVVSNPGTMPANTEAAR